MRGKARREDGDEIVSGMGGWEWKDDRKESREEGGRKIGSK